MKGSKSSEATRERILEAAERLFAERGFDGVSLRDITAAALANVAAVNYHFGTKEALMDQILLRYLVPLNEERLELLVQVERDQGGVKEILEALLLPLLNRMNEGGLQADLFCKLMGRCMLGDGENLPQPVKPVVQNVVAHFMKSLRRAMPGLSEEELIWRMHFTMGAIMHALLGAEKLKDLTDGRCGDAEPEKMIARLLNYCTAGIEASFTAEKPDELIEKHGSEEVVADVGDEQAEEEAQILHKNEEIFVAENLNRAREAQESPLEETEEESTLEEKDASKPKNPKSPRKSKTETDPQDEFLF